jgi:dihydrofolate reductase
MGRRTYESLERPTLLGRTLGGISQGLSKTPKYPEVIISGKSSVQHLKDHILYGGEAIFRKALEQLYLS